MITPVKAEDRGEEQRTEREHKVVGVVKVKGRRGMEEEVKGWVGEAGEEEVEQT